MSAVLVLRRICLRCIKHSTASNSNSSSKFIRNCGQRPNSKTIRHNTNYKIRLQDLKKIAENYTQINIHQCTLAKSYRTGLDVAAITDLICQFSLIQTLNAAKTRFRKDAGTLSQCDYMSLTYAHDFKHIYCRCSSASFDSIFAGYCNSRVRLQSSHCGNENDGLWAVKIVQL